MYSLLLVLHFIISVMLIILVLIQQGKGAEMGAAFGSGASATVFGSQGTGNFLFRLTGSLLIGFFITSLLISARTSYEHQTLNTVQNNNLKTEIQKNTLPVPQPSK
jgi:preprotein translocase subunit SecG